jgi:HSP20 family protein
MARLQREMNRLFHRMPAWTTPSAAPRYPAMNVWTSEEGAIVTAELPGVDPEDIDISVRQDVLTVSGCRNPQDLGEGETYHRRERECGQFTRAFQLPFPVDPAKVDADLENGVLTISLPRAEADKPRKINVKVG